MKAKSIFENISFQKGLDAKQALGVGFVRQVKERLEKIYGETNHRGSKFFDYKLITPDKIIISFDKDYIESRRFNEDEKCYAWIIKAYPIPAYEAIKYEGEVKWPGVRKYIIYKNGFVYETNPQRMKTESDEEMSIDVSIKESLKKANIIVDALNKEYPSIVGFELLEEFIFNREEYKEELKKLGVV